MIESVIEKSEKELSGIPVDARPFYYPEGNRAVVFIHGFSDSLCRVNGFAKILAERGVATRGVLLPGHGRTVADLVKTSPNDWYKEVEAEILATAKKHKEVYLVGISFGGNLCLKFDAKHPGVVKGIVTIESPMKIKKQYLIRAAIPFAKLGGMRYWKKKFLKKTKHPDKEKVFKQGVLDSMPLDNIAQIIDFLENKQGFLKKVKADLLVVQSDTSSLVAKGSAQEIYDTVSSDRKEILKIENVYHAFLNEAAQKSILSKSLHFFDIEI